jgi:hypothetical protein
MRKDVDKDKARTGKLGVEEVERESQTRLMMLYVV